MSAKIYFASGAAGTAVNVYDLADKHGFFDSPAACVFTVIVGLILCVFGGITVITVSRWLNKMADKIKGIV